MNLWKLTFWDVLSCTELASANFLLSKVSIMVLNIDQFQMHITHCFEYPRYALMYPLIYQFLGSTAWYVKKKGYVDNARYIILICDSDISNDGSILLIYFTKEWVWFSYPTPFLYLRKNSNAFMLGQINELSYCHENLRDRNFITCREKKIIYLHCGAFWVLLKT